jgi:protein-S-isoprenylcysteine O-methyltransferase Ste14
LVFEACALRIHLDKEYLWQFREVEWIRMSDAERKRLWLIPSSLFFIVVPMATIHIGGRIDAAAGLQAFPGRPYDYALGLPLLLAGVWVTLESIRVLLVEGRGVPLGDLVSSEQSTTLITGGIYARTRNPMLLGYLMALLGLGLVSRSVGASLVLPGAYTAIWTAWIKLREEPALEERFGEEYLDYRERTPFLVPGL